MTDETTKPEMAKDDKAPEKEGRYFVVNPSGAIHEVTKEHAAARLKKAGWRMATKAEVGKYKKTRVQNGKNLIAKPFVVKAGEEPEVEPNG